MHKYVLSLTRYTEAGAPTTDTTYVYADTPQGIADQYKKYNSMRYTNEDGTTGNKMFKVVPMQAQYAAIEDWDSFCATNAVLR